MAIYVAQQEGFGDRIGLFAGIDECRFKRVVQPGDRLSLEVTMDKLGSASVVAVPWQRRWRGRCEATISFIIPAEGVLR